MTESQQLTRIERKIDQLFALLRGECPHAVCEWENAPDGRQQVCAECGEVLIVIDGGALEARANDIPIKVAPGHGLLELPAKRR